MTVLIAGHRLDVSEDGRLNEASDATLDAWLDLGYNSSMTLTEFADEFWKLKDGDGRYFWSPDFGS